MVGSYEAQTPHLRRLLRSRTAHLSRGITEINSSIYVFDSKKLFSALLDVTADNAQNEHYLTDVPGIMKSRGQKVSIHKINDDWQLLGINTIEQLSEAEGLIREKGLSLK